MSYTTKDFSESLACVRVDPSTVARVIAAWGEGWGMGDDAGHYRWAEVGATDWRGGFLFQSTDGRYAYVTGWCDFTGWGCQDGAVIVRYDTEPSIEDLRKQVPDYERYARYEREEPEERPYGPPAPAWDIEPADLNLWLARALPTGEE